MQIKLTLHPVCPFTIPLNYNYQVQSSIYKVLQYNPQYASFIHNIGYGRKNAPFRLFTFGKIKGDYSIKDKKMWIAGDIHLELRSVSEDFCNVLKEALLAAEKIKFFNSELSIKMIETDRFAITNNEVKITTSSPIVAKYSNEQRKSFYFSPVEDKFHELINQNFRNKFYAYSNHETDTEIRLTTITKPQKVVTKYKETWITAYRGKFILTGEGWALDFLYQTGIGSHSSQGFGMFDVIR